MSDGRNRREFFRVFAYVPVSYRRIDTGTDSGCPDAHLLAEADLDTWHQLKVKRVDISGNGIFFETPERFHRDDMLEVRLFLEQVQSDIVVVCGRIVRVEEHPNHTGIAIQFIGMTERVLNALTAFVFFRERELIAEKRVGWL